MRRRVDESQGGPVRLRCYRPDDWNNDPDAYWAAVMHWQEAHPDNHLEIENGPDVPFNPEDL